MIDLYFKYLSQVMTAESKTLGEFYKTHGAKLGENRELVLQRVLSIALPKKLSVGSGFALFDPVSGISTQQDIVIYDGFNNPVLFPESSSPIFPPTAIHALIEVKSNLDGTEIKSAIQKAEKVKRGLREHLKKLERTNTALPDPIVAVFGFTGVSPETFRAHVEKNSAHIQKEDRVDLFCVLNEYVFIHGNYLDVALFGEPNSVFRNSLTPELIEGIKKDCPNDLKGYLSGDSALLQFIGYFLSYSLRRLPPCFDVFALSEKSYETVKLV